MPKKRWREWEFPTYAFVGVVPCLENTVLVLFFFDAHSPCFIYGCEARVGGRIQYPEATSNLPKTCDMSDLFLSWGKHRAESNHVTSLSLFVCVSAQKICDAESLLLGPQDSSPIIHAPQVPTSHNPVQHCVCSYITTK